MSNAELLDAYANYADLVLMNMSILITILFAFIIAVQSAVEKISWLQLTFLSLLLLVVCLDLCFSIRGNLGVMLKLGSEIEGRIAAEGSSISYLAESGFNEVGPDNGLVFWSLATISVLIFGGITKWKSAKSSAL